MVGHRRLRIRRVNRCAIERDNRPFCAIPHRYAIGPGVRNLAEERALRARARARENGIYFPGARLNTRNGNVRGRFNGAPVVSTTRTSRVDVDRTLIE